MIDAELSGLRQTLEARRDVLTGRMVAIQRDLRHAHEPLTRDADDQVTEVENDEVLQGLDGAGRKQLDAIIAALDRMDHGRYGVCAACGDAIAPARLQVVPWTTRCAECA
jgi:RNA polymerase-binding transcription factor DksA